MTPFYGKPNLLPLTRRLLRCAEVGHLRPHQHMEVMPLLLHQLLSGKAAAQTRIPAPNSAEGSIW